MAKLRAVEYKNVDYYHVEETTLCKHPETGEIVIKVPEEQNDNGVCYQDLEEYKEYNTRMLQYLVTDLRSNGFYESARALETVSMITLQDDVDHIREMKETLTQVS